MYFAAIYDKEPVDWTFKMLQAFLLQHTFGKFMDDGRKGMSAAVVDIVDNFERLYMFQVQRGGEMFTNNLPDQVRRTLAKNIEMSMMDGFIQQGTKGIEVAILTAAGMIHLELEEANKQ